MSSDWTSSEQTHAPSHEYETVADLWLSSKNGAFTSMRKLQTAQHRKKNNDKRDSVAQLTALTDGSPKKLREKTSWLGMSRGYATTASGDGQWVRVRCTLRVMDEPECRLTIVCDKGTLQHDLNVKMLRTTDIRFADRSLFFRSDCLSIHALPEAFMAHSPSLQTLVPAATEHVRHRQTHRRQHSNVPILDPIYLAFESKDAVNCWNALLRSYTRPEIYGSSIDGRGLYRKWRQVDLTVMHGRNLGAFGRLASTEGFTSNTSSPDADRGDRTTEASADSVVFCEVVVDGLVSGRTIFQKGQAGTGSDPPNWTWLEGFTFSDLPPFGILSIRVWRCKKSAKPVLVGTVEIALAHFRRGQFVEGWFPVMSCIPTGNSIQVGDLKLKVKVDEETILPSDAYSAITSILDSRNCLDLLSELDQKLHLGDISYHMLSLAVGRGTFLKDIIDLAEREVENAPNANTLFRGNSIFTKTVEQAMSFFGRPFLEASVGPCIQELCTERVELETDPSRNSRGPKDVEQCIKLLPIWCTKFWTQIYKMRDYCPPELRRLFQSIRELVERRFGASGDCSNLKWQSVSAFCFLRLIVPAILHPHLWGLHAGLPSPGLQRSLTLIAKALQSLANLSKEGKESHMRGVAGFLEQNHAAMIGYIVQISSPLPDRGGHSDLTDKYDRLLIMHALRDRREQTRGLTPLASEAIPVLPHLLDIPKHLAILSSAVIRNTRMTPQSLTSRPAPLLHQSGVEDFVVKCFEIEAKTKSVSLASPPPSTTAAPGHSRRVHSRRSDSPSLDALRTERTGRSRLSPETDSRVAHAQSIPHQRRKSTHRPSTAPAVSSSTSSSTFHTRLPSPPLMLFHGRSSDGSSNSSPVSPSARLFGKRPSLGATDILVEHRVTTSSPPNSNGSVTLRRTLSQQLDPHEIRIIEEAIAKRRGGFLRSLLSRNGK